MQLGLAGLVVRIDQRSALIGGRRGLFLSRVLDRAAPHGIKVGVRVRDVVYRK